MSLWKHGVKLVGTGNPVLWNRAAEWPAGEDFKHARELAGHMYGVMSRPNEFNHIGIGLAAPQVGEGVRLIVVNTCNNMKLRKHKDSYVMINPEVVERRGEMSGFVESCLSFPGRGREVSRHTEILVKFLDARGRPKEIEMHGLLARVVQHEVDHLDGIGLFQGQNVQQFQDGQNHDANPQRGLADAGKDGNDQRGERENHEDGQHGELR